ncbi:adipocyte plasma membrane-associated protein-like [Hibiscus syriacus]|uniref:Adipocyte plasma membrane-associated protein-like n=1 Tax=Hibiscus syriacus TaxID=106335 RepID=A0A6A2ZQ20_HIBSY|nr:adipocyte plasma membrane-associated protein-like [Hibiscus syriacus]
MADARPESDSQSGFSSPVNQPKRRSWSFTILLSTLFPVVAAMVVYQLDSFDPSPLPIHELGQKRPLVVSLRNDRMLQGAELLGAGELQGPEDIAYDSKSQLVYTGCHDGWIKRVRLNDSTVEKLVNTHGRPLGLALGHNNELIVADAFKGLLNISRDDASYKYSLHEDIKDIMEGRPHGRFLSFDPVTLKTRVLVSELYFANGVAVSPSQDYVIFCETVMRRCRKYYIKGNKQGEVEKFIDNLPGFPDNIKYDGDGHYWIALVAATSVPLDLAFKYPFIRKAMIVVQKYTGRLHMEENAGVLAVDLEGKPVAHYHDHKLSMITSGTKIGNRLYCGSVIHPAYSASIWLNILQEPLVRASSTQCCKMQMAVKNVACSTICDWQTHHNLKSHWIINEKLLRQFYLPVFVGNLGLAHYHCCLREAA